MKRIITAIGFIALLPFFSIGQQPCDKSFLGSKTLYESQQLKYTDPPNGYLPVFINDASRHGSRHLTKGVNTYFIYQAVLKADSLNALTAAGKKLKEKMLLLEKVEKGNLKSISDRGILEQQGLADRTYADYVNVFKTPKLVLNITYTSEVRTLQTSYAFVNELRSKIKNTDTAITRQINDTTLRFYDNLSPTYTAYKDSGDWRKKYLQPLKTYVKYPELANTISQLFFTSSFLNGLKENQKEKMAADLFGFITIFYSIQKEIKDSGYKPADIDMQGFLNCNQLAVLGLIDNAEEFYEKGAGAEVNGIQVKIAEPLLADFIKSTDEYIKTKNVNAQLRFCHAETIAPYAAVLGLFSASESTKDPKDIHRVWKSENIIPLSANIKWILYQKPGKEDYLVKFLLNEKEVVINTKAVTPTKKFYYKWNDVRAFYIKKIESFEPGANLNTNYVEYLRNLK